MQKTRKDRKVTGSQDDGFVGGPEYNWLNMQKHEKIEKVTAAQGDGFVEVLKKNIPNKLALMGPTSRLDSRTLKHSPIQEQH
jgi:hypothetical protein